jgi:acid phosphatase class B
MKTTITRHYKKYGRKSTSNFAIVLDMDDTLCLYDTGTRLRGCEWFTPREKEVQMALAAQRHGYDIVIATARPHFCYFSTLKWLEKHGVKPAAMYFRDGYGKRDTPTSELKGQMLTSISTNWDIEAFYDDSPFTIAAAQEMGVNAVLVAGNEAYWDTAKD